MSEELTLIGDYLGTIEEFMPGEGTYAENGKIYASLVGRKNLDKEHHLAKVDGKQTPRVDVGQEVFGEVLNVRKNIVTVIVSKVLGFKGLVDVKTGIYVSNISDKYVEKAEDMFGIGDIVKAIVIKIEGGVTDISTKGEYGVVKAFCKKCRGELVKSKKFEGMLECISCGHRENRKLAKDYGNVEDIWNTQENIQNKVGV